MQEVYHVRLRMHEHIPLSLIHICLDENGKVVLGDEMLTPDSSRFWPLEGYKPGQGPVSYTHLFRDVGLQTDFDSKTNGKTVTAGVLKTADFFYICLLYTSRCV